MSRTKQPRFSDQASHRVTLTGAGIDNADNHVGNIARNGTLQLTSSIMRTTMTAGGQVTSYTFYPLRSTSGPITTGQVFNYVINFANGQSVSGSLIAQ